MFTSRLMEAIPMNEYDDDDDTAIRVRLAPHRLGAAEAKFAELHDPDMIDIDAFLDAMDEQQGYVN